MKNLCLALFGMLFAGLATANAQTISGAGATFPYPVYSKWAAAYERETGVRLNYQSIGSGGGIAQIKAETVTFGASDAPLSGEELAAAGLAQWPMVMGGIVPVVNIEGVGPGELVLDGETLAGIFLGKIRKWNDPALEALNPGVALPDQAIAVIHRSDGSGTTFNFAWYLADVSADWKNEVGVANALAWPVGLGAKGNEGVAGNVMQTAGAIGYVEYAYALQNDLAYADMINAAGARVAPTAEAFATAAESADWRGTPGYGVILANQKGAGAWPMAAATFILMPQRPRDAAAAAEALKFFAWCYERGDQMALELHYVPMPDKVVAYVEEMWMKDIRAENGAPVYRRAGALNLMSVHPVKQSQ